MRAHMARGVCAESDGLEDTSHDLLSRATSVALKATDAIKEAADELQNWNDQPRRSGGAGVRMHLQGGSTLSSDRIVCATTVCMGREQQDLLARKTEALVRAVGQGKPDTLESYEGRLATFSMVGVPPLHTFLCRCNAASAGAVCAMQGTQNGKAHGLP